MSRIAVIDYGLGNIRSVGNAVEKVGGIPLLTRDEAEIMRASGLILPGVGAFQMGIANIKKYGLDKVIHRFVDSGKPVIGICLGMQLLLDSSEEHGLSAGLGLIPGKVIRLPVHESPTVRLPHVGWSRLIETRPGRWKNSLLSGTSSDDSFYFVHSFGAFPSLDENTLSETTYGDCQFASSVEKENVSGFQFHPEKSGQIGLAVIKRFVESCAQNETAHRQLSFAITSLKDESTLTDADHSLYQ